MCHVHAWSMPSSFDKIPYARIADTVFMAPQSIILQTRRGAHLNNDCHMISDANAIEIKHPCSSCDTAVISSFNTNKIPPTKNEKALFFKEIMDHKLCCLSLVSPYSELYFPNAQ